MPHQYAEVLFLQPNDRKRSDRDPDLTGTWKIDGQPDRWASGWWNKRPDGTEYLRVIPGREKEQRDGPQHPATANPAQPPLSARHRGEQSHGYDPFDNTSPAPRGPQPHPREAPNGPRRY